MGLVTLIYGLIAGAFGGFIGATIFTIIKIVKNPNSSFGKYLTTFVVSFIFSGVLSFVGFVLLMVAAFTS